MALGDVMGCSPNFGPNVVVNSIDRSSSDDNIKGDNGEVSINGLQDDPAWTIPRVRELAAIAAI